MKTDLYTRFILTVIAVSLVWIGSQRGVDDAVAQSSLVTVENQLLRVVICDEDSDRCADIARGGKLEVDVD